MTKGLKFKIGDSVKYILNGRIFFTGTIINAEVKRGLKPYTIKTNNGDTKFANESFIQSK